MASAGLSVEIDGLMETLGATRALER